MRQGHCYESSILAVLNGEPGVLVHGRAPGHGDHAWVEGDGIVHDLVSNKRLPVDDYHGVGERRYSKTEAMTMLLLSGHAGPWHGWTCFVGGGHPTTQVFSLA